MKSRPRLSIELVRPGAIVPRYATDGAAGFDLHAALPSPLRMTPGERVLIPTGLRIALPSRHEGQVRPRSGLALRHGVTVLNAPGTIDEDFRGELQVLLVHLGTEPFDIEPGDRIAQLVVAPVTHVELVLVDDPSALGDTARGAGGFGSTGQRARGD